METINITQKDMENNGTAEGMEYPVDDRCNKCKKVKDLVLIQTPLNKGGYEQLCTKCMGRELVFHMIDLEKLCSKCQKTIRLI